MGVLWYFVTFTYRSNLIANLKIMNRILLILLLFPAFVCGQDSLLENSKESVDKIIGGTTVIALAQVIYPVAVIFNDNDKRPVEELQIVTAVLGLVIVMGGIYLFKGFSRLKKAKKREKEMSASKLKIDPPLQVKLEPIAVE